MKDLKAKLSVKPEPRTSKGSGPILFTTEEKCVHGILMDRPCKDCDLAYSQPRTETTSGGRGHDYPADRALPAAYTRSGPVQVNTYYDDALAPNPSNQAVKMALKIIDRRIKHEGNVDLRALLDSQQGS